MIKNFKSLCTRRLSCEMCRNTSSFLDVYGNIFFSTVIVMMPCLSQTVLFEQHESQCGPHTKWEQQQTYGTVFMQNDA